MADFGNGDMMEEEEKKNPFDDSYDFEEVDLGLDPRAVSQESVEPQKEEKGFFSSLWESVSNGFSKLGESISSAFGKAAESLSGFWNNLFSSSAKEEGQKEAASQEKEATVSEKEKAASAEKQNENEERLDMDEDEERLDMDEDEKTVSLDESFVAEQPQRQKIDLGFSNSFQPENKPKAVQSKSPSAQREMGH